MQTKKLIFMMGMLAMLMAVSPVWADKGDMRVLSPEEASEFGGYGALAAEWWQWSYSIPVCDSEGETLHPLEDETGAKCYVGQRGPVWFIGGKIVADPVQYPGGCQYNVEAERRCTIPLGKALFVPVVNVECSTVEGGGKSEEQLRKCAEGLADLIKEVSVEIDGRPIPQEKLYRGPSSPLSKFFVPEDNALQALDVNAPGGTESVFVADGVHVLLAPVHQKGKHVIRFKGTAEDEVGSFRLKVDVTYYLKFVDTVPNDFEHNDD